MSDLAGPARGSEREGRQRTDGGAALDPSTTASQKRAPRLFHKKSRTGCHQCRARRVKCSEDKPVCRACGRFGLPCAYDPSRQAKHGHSGGIGGTEHRQSDPGYQAAHVPSHEREQDRQSLTPGIDEPHALQLEMDRRRRLELKLLHRYMSLTGPSIGTTSISQSFWVGLIPEMAVQSDSLLSALCAVTALHIALVGQDQDQKHMRISESYLAKAVEQHSREVADVADSDEAGVTLLCLTSSMLRVWYLGMLQNRSQQDPYQPPVVWLRTTASSTILFRRVFTLFGDDNSSIIGRTISSARILKGHHDSPAAKEQHRTEFPNLARCYDGAVGDKWDAYDKMVSDLGRLWRSIADNDPPDSIVRRTIALPMDTGKVFIDLVEERDFCALVMLAHYFAMLALLRNLWWVGDAGSREVYAIAKFVPAEWQGLMAWPQRILGLDPFPAPSQPPW